MSLLTTPEIRTALEWEPGSDAKAERLGVIVTALWETFTGRLWELRTDYEEVIELDEFEKNIMLPLFPLTSLTVVGWADGETEPDFSAPLTKDTHYTVNLKTGEVKILQTLGSNWFFTDWRHPDNWFKFKMTGGYTSTTLLTAHPQGQAIRNALLLQAQYEYGRNKPEAIVATGLSVSPEGGGATLRSNSYHPEFTSLAAVFRNYTR